MSVEDEQLWVSFPVRGLRSTEMDRGKRRVCRITAEEKQGADEVASDDRPHEIGHLFTRPNEVSLEIRQADLAFVSLLYKTDDPTLIWDDFHVGDPNCATAELSRLKGISWDRQSASHRV